MERLIERLAAITDHLVRFQTTELNHREQVDCLEWVKGSILAHKPQLNVQYFCSNEKPSYLITAGKSTPRILFCAHLDVVEAEHARDFTATKLDSIRMRGRGTADMKGPAAALIDIMMQEPMTGMGLLLTTDEELGGRDGTEYVLNATGLRPEVVILPDGGSNMRLITEQKALFRLRLISHGLAAHGSRPWQGDNAALHIYHGYEALLQAYPAPQYEDDWCPSITLSQISTINNPVNTVPGHAEGMLDVRFPDTGSITLQQLQTEITRILDKFQVECRLVAATPGFKLDITTPYLQRLQEVTSATRRRPMELAREAGASDARFFSPFNIPVLMFQPECSGWHGPDEWINVESLAEFRTICRNFARATLGKARTRVSSKSADIYPITSAQPDVVTEKGGRKQASVSDSGKRVVAG
jgi:succinyl-diaminopimelate desuccinylase